MRGVMGWDVQPHLLSCRSLVFTVGRYTRQVYIFFREIRFSARGQGVSEETASETLAAALKSITIMKAGTS